MRILHVLNHSLPVQDGYAMRTAAILREQVARGWETIQVTSDRHESGVPAEQVGDLHFLRTARPAGWLARQPVVEQFATIRSLVERLAPIVRDQRPDLLHAHSPCLTGLAALRIGRRFGVPVVYEMRSSWEDAAVTEGVTSQGSLRYRLSRALETHVLRRAGAVTTICDGLRAEIGSRGVPPGRVTVIPNAVDVDQFATSAPGTTVIRGRYSPTGVPLVGFIGSFYNWEGLDLLVTAAGILRDRGRAFRLVLVGGGAEDARLRAQVTSLGLTELVVFTGRVPHEEVTAYYGALDLLVYPRPPTPLTELVTPLKPLEAMAAGRPVLASDVAGHRELVQPGVTGLLFRAGDALALAKGIEAALDSPDLPGLAARARDWVRRERTWRASVARYAPVYASLVRGLVPA